MNRSFCFDFYLLQGIFSWPVSLEIIYEVNKVGPCTLFLIIFDFSQSHFYEKGGIKNLESSNVERPIFRNFEITNIKMAKDELFDYFICKFIFYYYFFKLLEHSKYSIIFPNYNNFLNFLYC